MKSGEHLWKMFLILVRFRQSKKPVWHADVDVGRLNNILMQLRKNCNHPDLITSEWEESCMFPAADVLVQQCGKMQVLDRLLTRLHAAGHKVLIFSQVQNLPEPSILFKITPPVCPRQSLTERSF